MKILRWALAGVLVIVLLLVLVLAAVFWRIDGLAKAAVERGGTYALGVDTSVGDVDVQVLGGEIQLNRLSVANAKGFKADHFMTLGSADVKVGISSLTSDLVQVPKIELKDIDLQLEKKLDGSNYQAILDSVAKLQDKSAPPSEKKFVVDDFSLKNVKVTVDVSSPIGPGTKMTIPIDEIKLTKVGKTGTGIGGTGMTLDQLTGLVVQAVMTAVVDKAGDQLPGEVLGDLKGALGKLGDIGGMGLEVVGDVKGKVEKIGEEVGKAAGDAAKDIRKGAERIGDQLKGVLGGKKDEKKKDDKK